MLSYIDKIRNVLNVWVDEIIMNRMLRNVLDIYIHQRSSHGMGQASQIGEQCAGIQLFTCLHMTQTQSQIL